jgi:glutamate 5-kinase
MVRDSLIDAEKIVIKVGSRVLLEDNGRPNYAHLAHLVEQIAALHKAKRKVIFVTSGAIGAGMEALGLKKRPHDLATLQAAAAIGQGRLIRVYEDLFASYACMVAQVLLTHDDLRDRARHLNIINTLNTLLDMGIIPIINENDTVAVDEIKFGDNDILASLLAMQIEAKVLVLLTTAEGFIITNKNGEKECLSHIVELNQELLSHIEAHKAGLSTGGMKSKILAAANMIHVGGLAVIAPGLMPHVLTQIFAGDNIGTLVGRLEKTAARKMPGRKRWIAFYNKAKGAVLVDDGAKRALLENGKSLLLVGVCSVEGSFPSGAVIEIKDLRGQPFAKGIAQAGSQKIESIMGHKKESAKGDEIVHRDDLVILSGENNGKNS